MGASKLVVGLCLSIPVVLLFVLVVLIGADPGQACAAGVSDGTQGATGESVAGLNDRQLQLARNGVVIGTQRHEPQQVIIAELAAQATESTLRNLANPAVPESLRYANDGQGYDLDSLGPHQMRASIWGAAGIATLMNPVYQINWFYQQADRYAGQGLSSPELAQAVERSAPDAYATQMDLARRLYAMFANVDPGTAAADATAGQQPSGCGRGGSGAPLSGDGGVFGAAVVAAAQRWVGTPYVWGGGDPAGPTNGGFDCSGLTLYAIYQASGGRIRLPHYTQAQQDSPQGQVVPFADRRPGDLIFFTSSGESDSHHVAIYLGRNTSGQDMVVHAPDVSETVRNAPLAAVAGHDRMDVRRYAPPPVSAAGPAPAPARNDPQSTIPTPQEGARP
ncbi:C40 family peptidase [Nocardia vaccinii]|uniref:C40 family peptidase n=1 Tax=Nocardia vaccinii TaxID=1822 RepID=UPI000A6C7BF9|nr:C40 family peptidase [Nocardia vaccinii]